MSDVDDSEEEERTQLNVALGELPPIDVDEDDPSTLMADPEKMQRLAKQAAADAAAEDAVADEPPSIVSFVSNVSVVSVTGPLPADVEPETMGSITLEPRSRTPADADPVTIEPRMGVRAMMPESQRSAAESETDTDVRKGVPRPTAKKELGALPKRAMTVIGLAPPTGAPAPERTLPLPTPDPDPKEAETGVAVQIDARLGTMPLVEPATQPVPRTKTAIRERTNSEEALIANALAIPPPETQPITPAQPFPVMAAPVLTPAPAPAPVPPPSNPALPVSVGSSPGIVPSDGPTPPAMSFVPSPAPPKKSRAGMVIGLLLGGLVLLGAGTGLGWVLRSSRLPAAVAKAAPAPPPPEKKAEPEPEKKAEPEPEKKPEPEAKVEDPDKKTDLELKDTPPTETTKKGAKAKPAAPAWKPAAPAWKPAAPKPSAKPAASAAPPKGFDPNGI